MKPNPGSDDWHFTATFVHTVQAKWAERPPNVMKRSER